MSVSMIRIFPAVFLCAALAACGGGGGGSPTSGNGGGNPSGTTLPTSPQADPVPPPGQSFRGENDIERKLGSRSLEGKVLLVDVTCGPGERFPQHCEQGVQALEGVGVPLSVIETDDGLNRFRPANPDTYWPNKLSGPSYAELLADLKVVAMPVIWPLRFPGVADVVGRNNVLFVVSAGNTERVSATGLHDPDRRDIYRENDITWEVMDGLLEAGAPGHSTYDETLAAIRTGKAILATWGDVDAQGEIVPYVPALKCGDTMHFCFTAVLPPDRRSDCAARGDCHEESLGTSFAAPVIAAHGYYFFQLWDQADVVVDMMISCAIDVGADGPDREFGVGVINADCPAVAGREVQRARESMQASMRSPLLDSLGQASLQSPSVSGPLFGFVQDGKQGEPHGIFTPQLFWSDKYRAFGVSVPLAGVEATGVWGYGTAPLGVSSTLAPTTESPFFEIGFEKGLLRFGDEECPGGAFSLAGSYGISDDEIDASAARLGLLYSCAKEGTSSFSLYVGALHASAGVGIPGRHDVGRDRVSVDRSGAEAFLRFGLRF